MMNALWVSKTGLSAQDTQLSTISNNLANVATVGFKRDRVNFEDLLYQIRRQPGAQSSENNQLPSGLQIGTGVRVVSTQKEFTEGSLQITDNALDVAINGRGFFEVLLPDGTTAYTRNGEFQLSRDGVLPGEAAAQQIGQLTTTDFVNPAGLEAMGGNLFLETTASGSPTNGTPGLDGLGTLVQGSLENSNVQVVEELVNMITTQRAYEMNAKVISTSDQMLGYITQNL